MLEHLLTWWKGKLFVLTLLGSAATDFIITITLSAADASAHLLQNPFVPHALRGHAVTVTLVLVGLLGAVFLKGFKEAVGIAVGLVGVYLALNTVVVGVGLFHLARHPHHFVEWKEALFRAHGSPWAMIGVSLLLFPKLALGLSGFETGVAMMPLVRGDANDDPDAPAGKIRNTHHLLLTAAIIMSVFLIASSLVTTLLIAPADFRAAGPNGELPGPANGRARAFLAHQFLGNAFGTVYDLSTIGILWFAGASAMPGLLNIVPRYPAALRHGSRMGPGGAVPGSALHRHRLYRDHRVPRRRGRARRSLRHGGARADDQCRRGRDAFRLAQRSPRSDDGGLRADRAGVRVHDGAQRHRAARRREDRGPVHQRDRVDVVVLPDLPHHGTARGEDQPGRDAERFVNEARDGELLRIIANHPENCHDAQEYSDREREQREDNGIPGDERVVFLEVVVKDASDFSTDLDVRGLELEGHRILRAESVAVPNAIAAFLLHVRDTTGKVPHAYFNWSEGNPILYLIRYLLSGQGDVAPVTREVLREAEPDHSRRLAVHAGI